MNGERAGGETAVTRVMRSEPPAPAAGRTSTSVILLLGGLIVLAIGTLFLYAKLNVFDSEGLADRAVAALHHAEVRDFISKAVERQAIERVPDLASNPPEVRRATREAVASDGFEPILRKAIIVAEGELLDEGVDNKKMQLQSIGNLIREQLAKQDPALAARVPSDLSAQVAFLGEVPAVGDALQAINKAAWLGLILPPIAIALLVASIAVAPNRGAAAMRLGVGLVVWAAAGFVFLLIVRAAAVGAVPAGSERTAAGPVWDEVVGPYRTWLVAAAVIGLLLAAYGLWRGRTAGRAAPA